MSSDTRSVLLRLNGNDPVFPHQCVICGEACQDQFEAVLASRIGNPYGRFQFFGRSFRVPIHSGICHARFKRTWRIWQRWSRNIIWLGIVGLLSGIPLYFITDNMYVQMGIALGIPAGAAVIAVICRDLAPFKLYEQEDGLLHKFIFRTEPYASEFAHLNARYLVSE